MEIDIYRIAQENKYKKGEDDLAVFSDRSPSKV